MLARPLPEQAVLRIYEGQPLGRQVRSMAAMLPSAPKDLALRCCELFISEDSLFMKFSEPRKLIRKGSAYVAGGFR